MTRAAMPGCMASMSLRAGRGEPKAALGGHPFDVTESKMTARTIHFVTHYSLL
jgi:hypothetical protein